MPETLENTSDKNLQMRGASEVSAGEVSYVCRRRIAFAVSETPAA